MWVQITWMCISLVSLNISSQMNEFLHTALHMSGNISLHENER